MPDPNVAIAVGAVFVAVAMLTGSIAYLTLERVASPVRRRLQTAVRERTAPMEAPRLTGLAHEAPSPILKKLSEFVPRSPEAVGRMRRQLALAGYQKRSHAAVYSVLEAASAFTGFLVPSLVFGLPQGIVYALLGGVVGYLLPSLVLDRKIKARQRAIQNGLPDALDLLIVCLEAGLALDHALLKCAEELRIAHPVLAEELRLVNVETRAGKPRLEAFKNFAARTKVDDVRSLVAMLTQTDRFGTSIAQALRTHAEVSRTKRRQRAEEAAAKIGVKLVFPLVFCLFPAFYVVTLGPAVVKFIDAFSSGGFATGVR